MARKNKFILVSIILLIAASLRFWRLPERAIFLGDQGRDLLLIRESFYSGKLLLTGQPTTQGINTGPFFYYLTLPSLLLTKFNPIGPIYFFTFIGVLTTFLIFQFCLELTGLIPAVITALFYATSPVIIQNTSGFWNPVSVPFFALLILFSLYQIQEKKKLVWFPALGFFSGIIIQFHASSYFIFLPILCWWLYLIFKITAKNKQKIILTWTAVAGFVFFITISPLLIFQLKNNFIDIKKISMIFFERFLTTSTLSEPRSSFLNNFIDFFTQQYKLLAFSDTFSYNLIFGVLITSLPFLIKPKSATFWFYFIVYWFLGGVAIISLYPGIVYPHYASFIWPFPFLIFAFFIKNLANYVPKRGILILGFLILIFQIKKNFASFSYINDLKNTRETSQVIIKEAKNHPFSLLLYSPRSFSGAHFRYFLTLKGANIKKVDDPMADYLFLICEKDCPNQEDLPKLKIIDSECLPECPPFTQQKTVNFTNWSFLKRNDFPWGTIYIFQSF